MQLLFWQYLIKLTVFFMQMLMQIYKNAKQEKQLKKIINFIFQLTQLFYNKSIKAKIDKILTIYYFIFLAISQIIILHQFVVQFCFHNIYPVEMSYHKIQVNDTFEDHWKKVQHQCQTKFQHKWGHPVVVDLWEKKIGYTDHVYWVHVKTGHHGNFHNLTIVFESKGGHQTLLQGHEQHVNVA